MAWTCYTFRMLDGRADSDADYRTIGKYFSDRLQDLSWTKTADTGQIDWATATRPGAPTANTKGGYEIRKSTMTSADVYLKISYGLGYSVNTIGIWLTSGEGSDGSGNLTGDQASDYQYAGSAGNVSPYEVTYFTMGDGGGFILGAIDSGTAANGFACGIQRTCNVSGADTSTGWYQYGIGYGSTFKCASQYVAFTGGAASQDAVPGWGLLYLPRDIRTTSALPVAPLYVQNGLTYSALRDLITVPGGAIHSDFDIPLYGSTHRFKGVMASTSANYLGFTGVVSYVFAVRLT